MGVYTRVYMAKLYWRVKEEGKWTWRPANVQSIDYEVKMRTGYAWYLIQNQEEEE